MDHREIVTRAVALLPRRWERVVYPDHPLLLSGPEILMSTGKSLVAVFVPRARQNPSALQQRGRHLLAALALPPETTCWVLDAYGRAEVDSPAIDGWTRLTDSWWRDIEPPDSNRRGVIAELKSVNLQRFDEAIAQTRERGPRPEQQLRPRAGVPSWRFFSGSTDSRGASPGQGRPTPPREGVWTPRASTSADATAQDFGLNQGRVDLELTAHFLRERDIFLDTHPYRITPGLISRSNDPFKRVRALAFAGLALESPIKSLAEMEDDVQA